MYGGANVGLMSELANSVQRAGGEVIGVIPKSLVEKEVAFTGLSDLRVTESMHERKAIMADLADGFIAMPGGLGTLEEFFEIVTWAQLGIHEKPCGLLNVEGYFDMLLAFLDSAVTERFVKDVHRSMLIVEKHSEQLLDRFEFLCFAQTRQVARPCESVAPCIQPCNRFDGHKHPNEADLAQIEGVFIAMGKTLSLRQMTLAEHERRR